MQSTLIASVLAASLALVANAQATDPAAIARQALDRLDAGEYAQVEQSFGAQMAAERRLAMDVEIAAAEGTRRQRRLDLEYAVLVVQQEEKLPPHEPSLEHFMT